MPETFELCTELIRPGGRVANVGVHGHPATLHLEKLWIRDVTDDDRARGHVHDPAAPAADRRAAGSIRPSFATHRFPLGETMEAYDVFADAAETHALKVVLEGERAVRETPAALAGTTA